MSGRPVRVPRELSARGPAARRDAVRMVVGRRGSGAVAHHAFGELPALLRAGDVLVVNTSMTFPAAVDAVLEGAPGGTAVPVAPQGTAPGVPGVPGGTAADFPDGVPAAGAGGVPVVVHFSGRRDDGRWAVELRDPDGRGTTRARPGGPAGAVLALPRGERLVLREPLSPHGDRLWLASVSMADPVRYLHRYGRPIRYAYTERDHPLSAYRSVFSVPSPDGPGSAEMPSAARPFTAALVAALVRGGVQFAPLVLHTGVASAESHEPPYPERFAVPESTAWLVNAARAGGGRIVAVGTTAVRALESVADPAGRVRAGGGWTDLVVTPERGVRAVDGLLTGLHEPRASHLLMLEAVAGAPLLDAVYAGAVEQRYLWHEFGDVNLLLP
ncbi:S-adenosylmethionine:tRNA ribosyltransferase-isomerase [Streptomyces sp. SL13]|uniref:S-adenosylmethionine:tRNA ribosyltransferase-isomerase n=1 Tax=Streptantibioticus silvisoli TaxID=2705255 RepID=A0AA90H5C7_9ACTN|nr:S-adenosylmethionine:tRNA ribosyltransferase-isomerase [Streptantibioticus silvisoli]MDI5974403.1 S-adenosylmethionine:tRNA ribosyltransferase-isomerase [Streptantibioticus silvisoli]